VIFIFHHLASSRVVNAANAGPWQVVTFIAGSNKCIGDDTKAAARRSPNAKLHQENKKIRLRTILNMAVGILLSFILRF